MTRKELSSRNNPLRTVVVGTNLDGYVSIRTVGDGREGPTVLALPEDLIRAVAGCAAEPRGMTFVEPVPLEERVLVGLDRSERAWYHDGDEVTLEKAEILTREWAGIWNALRDLEHEKKRAADALAKRASARSARIGKLAEALALADGVTFGPDGLPSPKYHRAAEAAVGSLTESEPF